MYFDTTITNMAMEILEHVTVKSRKILFYIGGEIPTQRNLSNNHT